MTDTKRQPGISFAISVPLIWYALTASRSVGRWLNMGIIDMRDLDYMEGSPIDRNVYSALIIIGVLILIKRRNVDWSNIFKKNYWILILFLYMGISILWSDFMGIAFKRYIKVSGDLIMALVVVTESNPLNAISFLLRICFYIHLPLSIIFIKYFRTIGVGWDYVGNEMWIGVATQKNTLGEVVMISGVYFIWSIIRNWGSKIIVFDLLFLSMVLWLLRGSDTSRSNTAIFGFLIGVIVILTFQIMRSNLKHIKRNTIILILLISLFFLTAQIAYELFSQKSLLAASIESSGRDATLTGRTELWNDILEIASHHPILGVGYGSFWIGDLANNLWERHIWKPTQGHNGYIDIYVELGFVGLFLLIAVIVFTFKEILKTFEFNFEYGRFRITIFAILLMHNITEASFLKGAHNLWFLFLLIVMNVPRISVGSRLQESSA